MAGLAAGVILDRPRLRVVRAELARARARAVAGRALARRELSAAELAERLARARVGPAAGGAVLASLERAGLVDDARAARARAAALAERGYGDAAIAARLEVAGIDDAHARDAIAGLEPEIKRARRLVAGELHALKAGRLLARRGFGPDVGEEILDALDSAVDRGLG